MKNEAPIWLFDSVCVLCENSVQFALRHEKSPAIQFVSIQSETGQMIAKQNGIDPVNPESFLFIDKGKIYAKSDGVLALSHYLRYPARLLFLIRLMPKSLRDWGYDLIARNRYRIFGRREQCIVPTPETRHRFILQSPST